MYVQWAIFVSRKSKENTSIEIIDILRFSINNHYGVSGRTIIYVTCVGGRKNECTNLMFDKRSFWPAT